MVFEPPLLYLPHHEADGEALFAEACRLGWEGLIAKRTAAPYQGRRSRDWLKLKCETAQEFVIGGFTDPKGSRAGFGALLLGYHDEAGSLRYAGKVGTGFDSRTLQTMHRFLRQIERPVAPFEDEVDEPATHWVDPILVCEIGFTEWTEGGRLRHPRFKGIRRDKPPRAVTREQAASPTP